MHCNRGNKAIRAIRYVQNVIAESSFGVGPKFKVIAAVLKCSQNASKMYCRSQVRNAAKMNCGSSSRHNGRAPRAAATGATPKSFVVATAGTVAGVTAKAIAAALKFGQNELQ